MSVEPAEVTPPEPVAEAPLAAPKPDWAYGRRLLLASSAGAVLVVPYSVALLGQMKGMILGPGPMAFAMFVEVCFEVLLSLALIVLGLKLAPRAGLGWPPLAGWDEGEEGKPRAKQAIGLAVGIGVGLALLLLAGSYLSSGVFPKEANSIKSPPWWTGFFASFGAGIREEVWLRFGVLTFLAGLGAWLTRRPQAGPVLFWGANLFAALMFGAIHLPQAAQLIGLTGPLVAYVLLANGVPGLVWGWLYARHGLVAAMVSHTVTDLVLKVVYPLLGL